MEYRILNVDSATGVNQQSGKPWTRLNMKLQRIDNNEIADVVTFGEENMPLVEKIGQTVHGFCFLGKEYKGVKPTVFKWADAPKVNYEPQSGDFTSAQVVSKLNEILGILHANFPTSLDMMDKKEETVEEEIEF